MNRYLSLILLIALTNIFPALGDAAIGGLKSQRSFQLHTDIKQLKHNLSKRSFSFGSIDITVDGQKFRLNLNVNHDLISTNAQIQGHFTPSQFLHGSVEGYDNSSVALTVFDNDMIEGSFSITKDGATTTYHIEQSKHHLNSPQSQNQNYLLVYKDEDISDDENDKMKNFCGTKHDFTIDESVINTFSKRSQSSEINRFQKRACNQFFCFTPRNPECSISLVADYSFYEKYGNDSTTYMLSLMNQVQQIYLSQANLNMPIIYAHVITNVSDSSGLGYFDGSISDYLDIFGNATQNSLIPGIPSSCMVLLLSYIDFSPQIGVSRVSFDTSVGLCAQMGFNVALASSKLSLATLTRKSFVITIAHELGHNLGSYHDDDLTAAFPVDVSQCNQLSNPFIMFSNLVVGGNSSRLSQCTLYQFQQIKWPQVDCLVNRGTIAPVLQQLNYTDNLYNGLDSDDICPLISTNLVKSPIDLPEYQCKAQCFPKNNQGNILVYSNVNLPLGTICGIGYPNPPICSNGVCVNDSRPYVCDRSKVCCNPLGVLQRSSFKCNHKASTNSICRPASDFCDPNNLDNPEECPINYAPPLTPCNCTNQLDSSTCNSGSTCGNGDSLGLCFDQTNNQNVCLTKSCPSNSECVVVANEAVCKSKDVESCRYICSSQRFSFNHTNGTQWSCSCHNNCTVNGNCCSDYQKYCVYQTQLFTSTTSSVNGITIKQTSDIQISSQSSIEYTNITSQSDRTTISVNIEWSSFNSQIITFQQSSIQQVGISSQNSAKSSIFNSLSQNFTDQISSNSLTITSDSSSSQPTDSSNQNQNFNGISNQILIGAMVGLSVLIIVTGSIIYVQYKKTRLAKLRANMNYDLNQTQVINETIILAPTELQG